LVRRVDVAEMQSSPLSTYVAGSCFAHFCLSPALWGVILWGRPGEADALELGRSLVLELGPSVAPHVSIVDATRLSGSDARAFTLLGRYLTHFGEALQKQVLRLALVRPKGLSGAVVTGAFDVVPRPYPVSVFDEAASAFGWLAAALELGGTPAELTALLARLHAELTDTPALVGDLRALMARHLRGLSLGQAAKSLGVSTRTLQRRLAETRTSFQDELARSRLRAAEVLLMESDAPLTAIAYDVGCASLQHFNAMFQHRYGESPSAWRRRRRGPDG
jgi:AraC-like DNA-binding protein